jgi:hypothetical protein
MGTMIGLIKYSYSYSEAETGSRLTNGYCAMSLNSNHVVINTMPNVIVDVGLPTVDV